MSYLRIRSIHVLRTFTRDGGAITRCGRRVPPPVDELPALPLDEKSCESCLRYSISDQDRAAEVDVPGDSVPVPE